VAAVLAGAYLLAKALDGGETRAGGRYDVNPSTGAVNFVGGPSGGEIASNDVKAAISGTLASINSALAGTGITVTQFYAGLESSGKNQGGAFAGGTLSNGQRFGDVTAPATYDYTQKASPSEAIALLDSNLAAALSDAIAKSKLTQVVAEAEAVAVGEGRSPGTGGMPTLATGTNFVPQDMVAMLHRGEAVVPAQYNPAVGGENVVAAEIRSLRDEVTLMRAETRSTAISTSKMARLQDNWDVRGLTVKTDADQPLDTVVV
jgi:hypothetical protein